jgi:hypothetical protein
VTYTGFPTIASTPNERFVLGLYLAFLKRAGATAELSFWADLLPTAGQASIVNAISHSPEAFARVVRDIYVEFLNRLPDSVGQQFWVNRLKGGATQEQIMASILSSPEFAADADALVGSADHNQNFVRALYLTVLKRSPAAISDGEVQFWVNNLQGGGPTAVATAFLGSAEFRANSICRFYGDPTAAALSFLPNLLHRIHPPTNGEVAGWVGSPLDLLNIETEFAGSQEFFANA